ncbi:MAG TPA: hypothetical protein VGL91_13765 [Acidobacteriota bacterium]
MECCIALVLALQLMFSFAGEKRPAGAQESARTQESLFRDLEEVARVATIMLDGDGCQRIMTARSLRKMFVIDPKDRWAASDNFDVDHQSYIQTKKTLIRLARLLPYPVDCNLWMPVEPSRDRRTPVEPSRDRRTPVEPSRDLKGADSTATKIQILIRNRYEMSQFWTWGVLVQDATPEMVDVLSHGRQRTVSKDGNLVSVLAPVYNSLGDVVGLVEVVSRVHLNPQENVK